MYQCVTCGAWNVVLTCVFFRAGCTQILDKARQTVMAKTGGKYPAPFKILDAIEVGACSFTRKDRIPHLDICLAVRWCRICLIPYMLCQSMLLLNDLSEMLVARKRSCRECCGSRVTVGLAPRFCRSGQGDGGWVAPRSNQLRRADADARVKGYGARPRGQEQPGDWLRC
jgi:hypothetical protein